MKDDKLLQHDPLSDADLILRDDFYGRAPSVEHRLVGALAVESSPTDLGGSSPADVVATRLRIPKREARRRIATPSCSGRAGH